MEAAQNSEKWQEGKWEWYQHEDWPQQVWEHDPVYDVTACMAHCFSEEIAQQIVGEHNAHQALKERIRTLTERLEALVDEGPFIDGETSECLTCGNHQRTGWRNNGEPHAPNCPWLLAKQALEEQGT